MDFSKPSSLSTLGETVRIDAVHPIPSPALPSLRDAGSGASARRRVATGRTDAEAGVVAATGESPVVRSRFYAFIKAFLVVSLLLLAVEVAAYFNGWDLAESALALPVIGLESLYAAWLRFRANYVAPGVQFLTDACIVLFLIQSADRLIQCLGCFYIHIKRIKPKRNSPALPDAEDPDTGYYPILVQIPMCNEKEVYQQ